VSETGAKGLTGMTAYHNGVLREIIAAATKYSGTKGICNPTTLYSAVPLGPDVQNKNHEDKEINGGIPDGIVYVNKERVVFDVKTIRFNASTDVEGHPAGRVMAAKKRGNNGWLESATEKVGEVATKFGGWKGKDATGWQARCDVGWVNKYIKKFKNMDIEFKKPGNPIGQGHIKKVNQDNGVKGPFETRHDELGNTKIISVGPHGTFTPLLVNMIEIWGDTHAEKLTTMPLDEIPSRVLGKIKNQVRRDCYSRIAFAAARGEALEIFNRIAFVATSGSVVKNRYSIQHAISTSGSGLVE
jgi:hypothetical protein